MKVSLSVAILTIGLLLTSTNSAFAFIKVTFKAGYCGDPWYSMCFGAGSCCTWEIGFKTVGGGGGGGTTPAEVAFLTAGTYKVNVEALNQKVDVEAFDMPARSFPPSSTGLKFWINVPAQKATMIGKNKSEMVLDVTISDKQLYEVSQFERCCDPCDNR